VCVPRNILYLVANQLIIALKKFFKKFARMTHGKNGFAERYKILAEYRIRKAILLSNVELSK